MCHRGRDNEPQLLTQEWIEEWKETTDLRVCLHPDAPNGCVQPIIAAHSIQKSGGGLKAIARNGKVLGAKRHIMSLQQTGGQIVPAPIGVNEASTFSGFCSYHDNQFFKPADVPPFLAAPEQLFLLNYRTLAIRLHTELIVLRQLPLLAASDRGKPRDEQRHMYLMLEQHAQSARAIHSWLLRLKSLYDLAWRSTDHDVNAVVIWLVGPPETMFAGMFQPDYSLAGDLVAEPSDAEHMCVYSIAVDGGVAIVFSWLGSNAGAAELCRSILDTAPTELPAVLSGYAFEYVDNIFLAPRWWDSLDDGEREVVIGCMSKHVNPFLGRDPEDMKRIFAPSRLTLGCVQRVGTLS